jgi:hypothetical protein
MHEKEVNKIIRYAVVVIIVYYIVQAFIPYIIVAVVGLVVWRVYSGTRKD